MSKNILDIINTFPKERPKLSIAHKANFEDEYKANREGKAGLATQVAHWLEKWMHKKTSQNNVEADLLEVGAGTLNHVFYETHTRHYDIVEPFESLFVDKKDEAKKIRAFYKAISEIPKEQKYDRIVSIATLEHMINLPMELRLINSLLVPNGRLQIGIPTEGGFLWGLAWRITTGLSYRIRTGLSYSVIMRHEHINTEDEIIALIKYYFKGVKVRRFPLNYKHLSFYTYISAVRK
ncbi:MAG: methyltransferase domain-containing protein [Methylococcaceae bacterium]|nr:methyltransferase domain-containing protein [Methylococcaceae bacterium]